MKVEVIRPESAPDVIIVNYDGENIYLGRNEKHAKIAAAAIELLEALKHAVEKFEEMGMAEGDVEYYKRTLSLATE